jgi:hypothetical protein
VARVLAAANRHDTEAFIAGFTADGVVDDWGREFAGADAIRRWSDREFIGVDVELTVTDVSASDRETTVAADVGGEGYNGASRFTFSVRGDLVSRMTIRE